MKSGIVCKLYVSIFHLENYKNNLLFFRHNFQHYFHFIKTVRSSIQNETFEDMELLIERQCKL